MVAFAAMLSVRSVVAQEPRFRMDDLQERLSHGLELREKMIHEKVEQIEKMEAEIESGRVERDAQMQRLITELRDLEKQRDNIAQIINHQKEVQEKLAVTERFQQQSRKAQAEREREMIRAEIERHHQAVEQTTLQARIAMDEVASAAFALQQLERLVPEPDKQLAELKSLLGETDHPAVKRLLRMKILAIAAEHDPDLAREQLKALILQRPEESSPVLSPPPHY
ncbi:hypothetical protein C5Y93_09875 [Blastopirellula marina]|uniref:Uncharacterized protein n=2 Tax=Blastopirellula marina TaxID=124 RepID=A0A2S8GPC7_9BACT|nr:hypothetical protein C5Y93_09875 [Blastopirellula marina]